MNAVIVDGCHPSGESEIANFFILSSAIFNIWLPTLTNLLSPELQKEEKHGGLV
jgi:hypothetical protein